MNTESPKQLPPEAQKSKAKIDELRDIKSLRDELAKNHAFDKFPVHHLTNNGFTQDLNFSRRMSHWKSYQDGFDSCANNIDNILDALELAVECLENIDHRCTIDNSKANGSCSMWSRETLAKIETVLGKGRE